MDLKYLEQLIVNSTNWKEVPIAVVFAFKEIKNQLFGLGLEAQKKISKVEFIAAIEQISKAVQKNRYAPVNVDKLLEKLLESPEFFHKIKQLTGSLVANLRDQQRPISTELAPNEPLEERIAKIQSQLKNLKSSRLSATPVSKCGDYIENVLLSLKQKVDYIEENKLQRSQLMRLKQKIDKTLQFYVKQESVSDIRQHMKKLKTNQNQKWTWFRQELKQDAAKNLKQAVEKLKHQLNEQSRVDKVQPKPKTKKTKEENGEHAVLPYEINEAKGLIIELKGNLSKLGQQVERLGLRTETKADRQMVEQKCSGIDKKLENYIKHICEIMDTRQKQGTESKAHRARSLKLLSESKTWGTHLVWNKTLQILNEENFKFENKDCSICVRDAGFYLYRLVFFCYQDFEYALLVNGTRVLQRNSKSGKDFTVHGLGGEGVLLLPHKSRLTVEYSGGKQFTSFIEIAKL